MNRTARRTSRNRVHALWRHLVLGVVTITAVALGTVTAAAGAAPGDATTWLCRPGQASDPCGGRGGEPIDCFYVYPTVSLQLTTNADHRIGPEERLIAAQQAAPFGQKCNVWAPVYRQSTLRGLFTSTGTQRAAALDIAFDDLEKAWNDYLLHHNHGRGVVFIGHSQGSLMLRTLIRTRIENTPAQSRLVSAILLGGNVLVRKGSLTGGDFRSVPACTQKAQFGCVVAYSAFNRQPPADSRFGRAPSEPGTSGTRGNLPFGSDYEVLCTNPASLGRNAVTRLHSLIDGRAFAGYSGACSTGNGPHVLRVSGGGTGAPPASARRRHLRYPLCPTPPGVCTCSTSTWPRAIWSTSSARSRRHIYAADAASTPTPNPSSGQLLTSSGRVTVNGTGASTEKFGPRSELRGPNSGDPGVGSTQRDQLATTATVSDADTSGCRFTTTG